MQLWCSLSRPECSEWRMFTLSCSCRDNASSELCSDSSSRETACFVHRRLHIGTKDNLDYKNWRDEQRFSAHVLTGVLPELIRTYFFPLSDFTRLFVSLLIYGLPFCGCHEQFCWFCTIYFLGIQLALSC